MMANTQPYLLKELKQRIADGVYTEKLPAAVQLAEEFRVNVKTMNKVLNQLAAAGIVERRRHSGTVIRHSEAAFENRLIEVVFSGFSAPFQHPFWSEVLEGIHNSLLAADYRMVLNHIASDPKTHLFDLSRIRLFNAAGRVVVGPGELRLLDWLAATRRPLISAGDEVGVPDFPQIYFDFRQGISNAISFLFRRRKCRNIGFIGHVSSLANPGLLQKLNVYIYALQKFRQIDWDLIEGAWPYFGEGAEALKRLLARKRPDALLVAFGSQVPEIRDLLRERGISIPIVGCDGLPLADPPEDYHTIRVPRRECGRRAAELLLESIRSCGRKRIGSHVIPAVFE